MSNTKQVEIPVQTCLQAALLNNIAITAASQGGDGIHSALAYLRRAMAMNPRDLGHRLNLANYLIEMGEDGEAEELVTFALKHDDRLEIGWQIMGVLASNRGRMEESVACFKRAYEIAPDNGQRRFDLAAAYLRAGQWLEGWPWYEARSEILPKVGRVPDAPTWEGQKTGHLAIWPDQGHGDLMMFARLIPWAKERAHKITVLVTTQVVSLFQGYAGLPGVEVSHTYDSAKVKFDHQICCASLPMVFGLTPDNIPADPGLLTAAPGAGRFNGSGLKIGIAWQGNPQFPGDRMRSIPFREFLPLAADPRNTLYSLQIGPAAADIAKARAQKLVRDMSPEIDGEWSHTATVINELDLIVSSCTAVPHLAGAMGKECFIVVPQFADWRWLSGRDDTPWYPKMRIFRQTKAGRWADAFKQVTDAIGLLHQRRALAALLAPKVLQGPCGPREEADLSKPQAEADVMAVMRRVLREGDTFVDVGANVGLLTTLGAKLVGPTGRVIAFEPGQAFGELSDATKDLSHVELFMQPVADAEGPVTFHLCSDGSHGDALWPPQLWTTNRKSQANPRSHELDATTLDREIHARGISPRLVKIDTEGAEQRVLHGAVELLLSEQRPPFIVAELHPFGLGQFGHSQETLRAFMRDAGYETFLIFGNGAKPNRITPDKPLQTEYILNLLYARQSDVDEVWGNVPEGDMVNDKISVYPFKQVSAA